MRHNLVEIIRLCQKDHEKIINTFQMSSLKSNAKDEMLEIVFHNRLIMLQLTFHIIRQISINVLHLIWYLLILIIQICILKNKKKT